MYPLLKKNLYFCTSLTVQTVLKSWSLAVGQLWDFPQRGKHGEFVTKIAIFGEMWVWFCTDR